MKGNAKLYGKHVGGDVVVTIDREVPFILENKVSDREWIDFCNEVDTVLEPLTVVNRKMQQIDKRMKPILCINFIVFLSGFVAAKLEEEGIAVILFIAAMIIFFAFIYKRHQLYENQRLYSNVRSVIDDLRNCCTEASSQHSNVIISYKVKSSQDLMKSSQDVSVAEALQGTVGYFCGGQWRYVYYIEVMVPGTDTADIEMPLVKSL